MKHRLFKVTAISMSDAIEHLQFTQYLLICIEHTEIVSHFRNPNSSVVKLCLFSKS